MTEPLAINVDVNNSGNKIPGRNFFKELLRWWWLFLIVALISGIIGIFYAAGKKPKYESRLTFSLDAGSNLGSLSNAMSLAAQFGLGFGGGQNMFDGDNILEIMKSRRMVENVLLSIDTFGGRPFTLMQFYLEQSNLQKVLAKNDRLKNINFPVGLKKSSLTYLQDSILYITYVAFVNDYISATRPDRKLSIYEVRITSENEKFSKVFTDRIVSETSNFYADITSKKDRETLEILEQRVASLKSNVGSSIDVKANNQDANINPSFQAAQSPIIKQQYNMQAYGEAYKEMFKTLEMARYQYLKQIPLLQVIDHADYPMKIIKAGKLKTGLLFSILASLVVMLSVWCYIIFRK